MSVQTLGVKEFRCGICRSPFESRPQGRAFRLCSDECRRVYNATKSRTWRARQPKAAVAPQPRPWVCTDCGKEDQAFGRGRLPERCRPCDSEHDRLQKRIAYRTDLEASRADSLTRWRKRGGSPRMHNLTQPQFDEMLVAQDGACAICRSPSERLFIDHDHSCCPGSYSCGNCVRGLLCPSCNTGLGTFKDNPEALAAAIAYLSRRS